MKKTTFLFLLLSFLFVSCDKEPDNLIVTINRSAEVFIKVLNKGDNALAGAKVFVYSSNTDDEIYYGLSNENGMCNLGKLLEGEYYAYVSYTENNLEYTDNKAFQVISDENKTIELAPYKNVETVNIQILLYDYYDRATPFSNINVAISPLDWYDNNRLENVQRTPFKGITDSSGNISFENVPAGIGSGYMIYYVYVYDNNYNNYNFYSSYSIRVTKDITTTHILRVYE